MTIHAFSAEAADTTMRRASQFSFWAALCMSAIAAAALALAIATPPRSGPFCASACVTWPYTNIAAFFPRDYLWMYPALLLTPLFVVFVACIYAYAPTDKKLFGLISLCFAAIAAAMITIDYFIQLTIVQPSLLNGEAAGLSLISQYNPHGIFIALESLGYIMIGVAFVFVAPVFAGHGRAERAIRWLFSAGGALAIGALIVLALVYGNDLEYRFEVAVITIDWTVLVIAGVLVGLVFRRAARDAAN